MKNTNIASDGKGEVFFRSLNLLSDGGNNGDLGASVHSSYLLHIEIKEVA